MKSTEIKDIVNSRILKTVKLPIEFENCDNPIIFNFDTYNSLTPNWYYKVLR